MNAAGFISYARVVDDVDEGQITEFRKRLENEVSQRLGEKFKIFQDTDHIIWGQHWKQQLQEGIEGGLIFIPIITPFYLKRHACREELSKFLTQEKNWGREDLVFPLLYIDTPAITNSDRVNDDPLALAAC